MIRHIIILSGILSCVALLPACSGSDNNNARQAISSTAMPSDQNLADLYQQTCMACHTRPASGAPQTGNADDWAPRLAKGYDTLLDNTINGYRGMPPLGSCMDCDEQDFTSLIDFMSQPPQP